MNKITSPIKSMNYGKAGLVQTTKKEIVPVETSKIDYVEKTEHKVTPVKKYHYV